MDALSAPLKFASQAERRAKQMQVMGIDASDIVDVPATGSKRIHDDNNDSNPQLSKVMPSTPSNKAFNSTATPDDKRKGICVYFLFSVKFITFCFLIHS